MTSVAPCRKATKVTHTKSLDYNPNSTTRIYNKSTTNPCSGVWVKDSMTEYPPQRDLPVDY